MADREIDWGGLSPNDFDRESRRLCREGDRAKAAAKPVRVVSEEEAKLDRMGAQAYDDHLRSLGVDRGIPELSLSDAMARERKRRADGGGANG
jgi:hypothetical protein